MSEFNESTGEDNTPSPMAELNESTELTTGSGKPNHVPLTENAFDELLSVNRLMEKDCFKELVKSIINHIDSKIKAFDINVMMLNSKLENINVKLASMDATIKCIQKDIDETKTFIAEKKPLNEQENIITYRQLLEMHTWNLPLQNIEDFTIFDGTLTDKAYADLKSHWISTINSNLILGDICKTIFKNFFTRNLLKFCTAQTKMPDKQIIFKNTRFYNCLYESLLHVLGKDNPIDEQILLHVVGQVINNSIDWEGNILKRVNVSSNN